MTQSSPESGRLAMLLQVEQSARRAETLVELCFVMVNETRSLATFAQAAFLSGREDEPLKVKALSDLPTVDRTAPFVAWAERLARRETNSPQAGKVHPVARESLSGPDQQQWSDFAPRHLLWVPLAAPGRGRLGALLLTREEPWDESDIALLSHLGSTFGHALWALAPHQLWQKIGAWLRRRYLGYLILFALAALMLVPVRLSVLAPAEISPRDPAIVTAPLDGVVQRLGVEPNDRVAVGDLLVQLEETVLNSRFEVAERTLAVAMAELHKTRQSAFIDAREKGSIAELEAMVELQRAERDFARAQLENTKVRADRAGIAVLGDPRAWQGRPVAVGERVLSIADPARVELSIFLPVKDAIMLEAGAMVKLFLDVDPLHALEAEVVRAAYEPEITPDGTLAYRVTARFSGAPGQPPRIGLRGTAKIFGRPASLFYYLFRRPITALRQWVGY